jgi:hypothetical protein
LGVARLYLVSKLEINASAVSSERCWASTSVGGIETIRMDESEGDVDDRGK